MAFVDFEKAFDRIPRGKLFAVLEEYGVSGKLLNSVKSLYSESLAAVRTASLTHLSISKFVSDVKIKDYSLSSFFMLMIWC